MARVNVELKARDPDPEATLARCLALGAEDAGELRQTDTYFMARRGRLKLRTSESSELIAYRRPDDAEASESTYVLAPVSDPDALAEALDAALGTTVVVSKRRRLFLWEGVRIHLDEVEDLGSFVEFEAVLPDAGDLATAHEKVARLRAELGIEDDALVSVGYADLLLDSPQALLRAAEEAMRNAYAPVLAVQGRRRGARAERRDLRRRERGERRVSPGAMRGGLGPGRAGGGRRNPHHRGGGGRGAPRGLSAVRGVPAAPVRVRRRFDAGVPRAGDDDLGRAPPRRVRPRGARLSLGSPRVGVVLGSGLGAVADAVEDPVVVGYEELPGFPRPTVSGHAGRAVLGTIGGVPVAVLQGRAHLYEGGDPEALRAPVRALRAAGAETLILTNAAGSLHPSVGPGSLMAIVDHINMQGANVLMGPNDDAFGPRFPSLRDAYDPELLDGLRESAGDLGIELAEGVYLAVTGPSFETPAEIRAYRVLGADAVGMSTVQETILARHSGMRVAAVSVITNLAEGMSDEPLSHEQTLRAAQAGAGDLTRLLLDFIPRC